MKKKFLTTQDMVLIAVFTALMVICSWISINIGAVPFTLQTFAVFVIGGLLGVKKGIISIIVYILLGIAGVPVFSGFKAGPAVIVGPTGGYIVGFIFTIIIIGFIVRYIKSEKIIIRAAVTAASMVIGDIACLAFGTVWFMNLMKMNFIATLSVCVIPYIIPDLFKIAVATILVLRLKKYINSI